MVIYILKTLTFALETFEKKKISIVKNRQIHHQTYI